MGQYWYDNGSVDLLNTASDLNQLWTFFERVAVQPPMLVTNLRFRADTMLGGTLYRLGLYSDVAAAPSALLAQTAAFPVVNDTTYSIQLLANFTLTDDYVWVARQTNSNNALPQEAASNLSTYRDIASGGYPAGFPAIAVANPWVADPAWCGVFTEDKVPASPQGCYYIEYSIDGLSWFNISGFSNSIRTPRRSRRFSEIQAQSEDTPHIAMGKRPAERLTFDVLYTEADGMIFNQARQQFENNQTMFLRFSPVGGAAGDYRFSTDTVYSYIVDMEVPPGDSRRSADPLRAVFTVITQEIVQGTVP